MRFAFLILCHCDEDQIKRLANKISSFENFDVFIHVDLKTDISKFRNKLGDSKSVFFVNERYDVSWGGYSAVEATMSLIKSARQKHNYDRYILLQGLDYPLKTNRQIYDFFDKHKKTEFIRGCNVSESNDKYFYSRCRYYLFYEKRNQIKRIINKLMYFADLRLKSGYIIDDKIYDVYWGSALWALTGDSINYIIDFHASHNKFNKYFKYMFPVDELYFTTIIFNSEFAKFTSYQGSEEEKKGLVNWRNLHYFEYPEKIKMFSLDDFQMLRNCTDLFCRKVNTQISTELLDEIDNYHNKQDRND